MATATPETIAPTLQTEQPTTVADPQIAAVETALIKQDLIVVPAEPEKLAGLSPKEVQSLMGAPSLVRRDNSVQVMLYESPGCVFEVFFFEPDLNAHFRAADMNARTRAGVSMDLQTCLAILLPNGYLVDNIGGDS